MKQETKSIDYEWLTYRLYNDTYIGNERIKNTCLKNTNLSLQKT